MHKYHWIVFVCGALLVCGKASAHPGHAHHHTKSAADSLRAWTDSAGRSLGAASFVMAKDGHIQLRRTDGSLFTSPVKMLSDDDQGWVYNRLAEIRKLNTTLSPQFIAQRKPAKKSSDQEMSPRPVIVKWFDPFKKHVSVRWNDRWLYVESDGLPNHRMMVGITAWNQQVPIPHSYRGDNAFRIPLVPKVAAEPTAAPYKSAIAIAVNGVPIFHPIKQDGRTDTLKNGELDEFGGHAGRGDDYHYHIAPRHLEKLVGKGNPVAFSLDGYPILVAEEQDGKPVDELDKHNGRTDKTGRYAYYSTTRFPYLNISYRGEVDLDSRPRARGVRPFTRPLRGATITGFKATEGGAYSLQYRYRGGTQTINYMVRDDGSVKYTFIDEKGNTKSETHERRRGGRRKRKASGAGADRDRKEGDKTLPASRPPPSARGATGPTSKRPNFVFILMDDMGWRDVGFAGNTFVETPHIDKLAREGMAFTAAYASAPNCAPTRACLMSGQYTPRHGVFTVVDPRHAPGQAHHKIMAAASRPSMAGEVVTIPEALKSAGYATAAFGMWNLGRGPRGPTTATGQGFDLYKKPQDLGFERNAYFDRGGKYLTDRLFDEGLRFVEANRERPFFLYLPTHAIHAPFDPKPALLRKYREKAVRVGSRNADPVYAAMIEAVDQNVGRMMETLRRLKIADNTVVVFTSDNGGTHRHTGSLNGGKGTLYEGGLRVPLAVWWSGIANPGRTCAVPVLSMDFYPTMLDIAGVSRPNDHTIDGESLFPLLRQTGRLEREAVFWHFPCYVGRATPSSAIRQGEYKLIEFFENRHVELYNLKEDASESKNLSKQMPDKAKQLHDALVAWRTASGAPVPTKLNPNYDAKAKRPRGRRGRNDRK